jgi:uncharacterized membrane protein
MNITVYNKTYLYAGAFVGFLGGYLSDEKIIPLYLSWVIIVAGIILMLLSMKKPNEAKNKEL